MRITFAAVCNQLKPDGLGIWLEKTKLLNSLNSSYYNRKCHGKMYIDMTIYLLQKMKLIFKHAKLMYHLLNNLNFIY